MKFLIIDDIAITRRLLRYVLKSMGYEDVVEACDGADALHKMKLNRFDVIITDWAMPNMDGLHLVQSLRAHPDYAETPILMVTSNALPNQIREAILANVTDYVVKPFTVEMLRERIGAVVQTVQSTTQDVRDLKAYLGS